MLLVEILFNQLQNPETDLSLAQKAILHFALKQILGILKTSLMI